MKNKKNLIIIIVLIFLIIIGGLLLFFKTKNNTEQNTKISQDKGESKKESNDNLLKEYKVTFNSNGGSLVKSINVKEGDKVLKPDNPTRNGYTFEYWTLNDKEFDFTTTINENIILTAVWKKESISNDNINESNNENSTPQINTKKESTIEKINLNDYPITIINYANYTQPICYYYITNLKDVFPELAGKTNIILGFDDATPDEIYDIKLGEWYASFNKFNFDTAKENNAKNTLENIKNKKYKGIIFESNIGSNYSNRENNFDFSENHCFSYKYEYLNVNKETLNTLYTGIESVRNNLNSELNNITSGAIKVTLPGYGVYGQHEGGILNEDMCQKYNLVCDRW